MNYIQFEFTFELNIKLDFQENSLFSTSLWALGMNRNSNKQQQQQAEMCEHNEFLATSHHVTMVLIVIHDSYHVLKCKP